MCSTSSQSQRGRESESEVEVGTSGTQVEMGDDSQGQADRKFYDFPDQAPPVSLEATDPAPTEETPLPDSVNTTSTIKSLPGPKKFRSKSAFFRGNAREIMDMVDRNIVGRETVFQGPFGPRRCKF